MDRDEAESRYRLSREAKESEQSEDVLGFGAGALDRPEKRDS